MSCPVLGLLNNSFLLFVFNVHAFASISSAPGKETDSSILASYPRAKS